MPNGRSGGFPIEAADLVKLIGAFSHGEPIGKLLDDSASPKLRTVDATEIIRLIEERPLERLAVEEQDHTFYVIHIRNEPPLVWVVVDSESPILAELKQRHVRWNIEHPNWTGWLGF
jgi:hypothetical protein